MDAHKNFAYSTVLTAPSPATSGTSLVVQSGDGTKFPAVPFNAPVWPAGAQPTTANAEIVRVTGISTDTLTIARAQESTSARTIVIGDQIAATITAKTITDIETDLASADTQMALNAAKVAAILSAESGYFVASGCALSVSATAGKVDLAAGIVFQTPTELNVSAATPATTITTLASGLSAGQALWCAVEIDTSGVAQFNSGTGATTPTFPTITAGRVLVGWLYVPFGATTVSLSTSGTTDAKLFDARVVRPNRGRRQVFKDSAHTTNSAPSSLTSLLASTYSMPANSLAVGDLLVIDASGRITLPSTGNTSDSQFEVTVGGSVMFNLTTNSLTKDGAALGRQWILHLELLCTSIGASSIFDTEGFFIVSPSGAATTALALGGVAGGTAGSEGIAAQSVVGPDTTAAAVIDLLARFVTTATGNSITLRKCTISKEPTS